MLMNNFRELRDNLKKKFILLLNVINDYGITTFKMKHRPDTELEFYK